MTIDTGDYPLTVEDVKRYLATKQDNEPIGICFNAYRCVLAETLEWLYPEQSPWRVDIGTYAAHHSARSAELAEPLSELARKFDHGNLHAQEITKAQFRTQLTSYRADELSFAVTDVFPEVTEREGLPL